MRLNEDQQNAYDLMTSGRNVFLTGPGGCGKTALIKYFVANNKYRKKIAVTSTTGTSALLINGTTLHSYLGIGLGKASEKELVRKIFKRKYLINRWRELEVLIIDEVSMLSPELFDKLDYIARATRDGFPFGSIQLILSGDFCQLPCVDNERFCFESEAWKENIKHVCHLTKIIRQNDIDFQKCLNEIRLGDISEKTKEMINSRVKAKIANNYGIKPTKLFPLNQAVDNINSKELDKVSRKMGEIYDYPIEVEIPYKKYEAIAEKMSKFCPAVEELSLCTGSQVMLIQNLDLESKLANGSRGIVVRFEEELPVVRFLNGVERVIGYHTWEIRGDDEKKIATVTQIPLKLAYAFSIHKSQGVSLDCAKIDLRNIFEYGMGYVALSRIKNFEGLSISGIDWDNIAAHPKAVEFYKN